MKRKVIVAVTGASGSIYAQLLLEQLEKLTNEIDKIGVVFSTNAIDVWRHELKEDYQQTSSSVTIYEKSNFYAPFASGSADYDTMIICPCSMGMLGRVAHGYSEDLIARAADVILKENRKLILVPRETPYNLVHIENMQLLIKSGAIICPASPSFYSIPKNIQELSQTVVSRILSLADFKIDRYKWGE